MFKNRNIIAIFCVIFFATVQCSLLIQQGRKEVLVEEIKRLRTDMATMREEFTSLTTNIVEELKTLQSYFANFKERVLEGEEITRNFSQSCLSYELIQNITESVLMARNISSNVFPQTSIEPAIEAVQHNTTTEETECEWKGVKGVCVHPYRCLTTLDKTSPFKHPVCSDDEKICCTDCNLFYDTRQVFVSPVKGEGIIPGGGSKARDHCLRFMQELPYKCHKNENGRFRMNFDEVQQCHNMEWWAEWSPKPDSPDPTPEAFPYQAILGYGTTLESAYWEGMAGVIITRNYILTNGFYAIYEYSNGLHFVAVGVENPKGPYSNWQTHKIKRVIMHPEYDWPYNDVALLELETPIQFHEKVLPACLPVETIHDDEVIHTTWYRSGGGKSNSIRAINMQKFTEEECRSAFDKAVYFEQGYNATMHVCYERKGHMDSCSTSQGDPVIVMNHISSCVYTVVGLKTYEKDCGTKPDLYTRVEPYVPWIESVVWPWGVTD